jgi:Asp-tRNA(Asn)/Glu-tRNA(Gln) amidotransferase A subunit family amidase
VRALVRSYPFTYLFNLACCAAISVPASGPDDGLPIGLQPVAPRVAEWHLLQAASAYECIRL